MSNQKEDTKMASTTTLIALSDRGVMFYSIDDETCERCFATAHHGFDTCLGGNDVIWLCIRCILKGLSYGH